METQITEYSDYYKKEITYTQYIDSYSNNTIIKYNFYNSDYYKYYTHYQSNKLQYKSYSLGGIECYLKFNINEFTVNC